MIFIPWEINLNAFLHMTKKKASSVSVDYMKNNIIFFLKALFFTNGMWSALFLRLRRWYPYWRMNYDKRKKMENWKKRRRENILSLLAVENLEFLRQFKYEGKFLWMTIWSFFPGISEISFIRNNLCVRVEKESFSFEEFILSKNFQFEIHNKNCW